MRKVSDPRMEQYAKQSEYFIKKYGIGSSKPANPLLKYERTCNVAGYDKVKKRMEMESTVFTGFNQVMKVPTSPKGEARSTATQQSNRPTNENRPIANIPVKLNTEPKIVKIRLRLKSEQVDQSRLQDLTDKLTFKLLPKGYTMVEAVIEESSVKMFQNIFRGSTVAMEIIPVS